MSAMLSNNFGRERVLMLTWEYPPNLIGGLARAVCALSRKLVQQGCDVHVLTAAYDGAPEQSVDEGVIVHWLKADRLLDGTPLAFPPNNRFHMWLARLNMAMAQKALMLHADAPFDVIHAHDWLVSEAATFLQMINVPLVTSVHATEYGQMGGTLDRFPDSVFKNQLNQQLVDLSRAVIVNSRRMQDEVQHLYGTASNLVNIISNGVDIDRLNCDINLSTLREKHHVVGKKVVLYVGRLRDEKGVDFLVDAAPAVFWAHPDAHIIIAGHGEEEDALRSQAARLGITERVTFFGMANDQQLGELYKLADMLIVPSRYEPFGLVALEGMAAQLPVIASKTGGLQEFVIDGQTGFTFPNGDVKALATTIIKVLGDKSAGASIGKAAREFVASNYSWDLSAGLTLKLYQSVVHQDRADRIAMALFK